MCQGGYCKCNPSASYSLGQEPCPSNGQCGSGLYSTPNGACSKTKGDCVTGQHYEYELLRCVDDVRGGNTTPGDDTGDALAGRLDKIVKNTADTVDALKIGELTHTAEGSFGSEAEDALAAAKTEFETKFTEVKSGLSSAIGDIAEGSGELPSFDLGNIKGQAVFIDVARWSAQLSSVPGIIIAFAWLMALTIILGRR